MRGRMIQIANEYSRAAKAILSKSSCYDFARAIPDRSVALIVTSPPYNLGKKYEKKSSLDAYYDSQERIIDECVRVLADDGSICWQVGNFVRDAEIVPLDILLYPIFRKHNLKLRNRIIWQFGHGLHASKRFSGRYETILWFTKTDAYTFNLDQVRVPQKYPAKRAISKGQKPANSPAIPSEKTQAIYGIYRTSKITMSKKRSIPANFLLSLLSVWCLR